MCVRADRVLSWCPAVPPCCSHKDLAKDAAPHFRKAKKFYDALATEMVSHGHICDIFSCALDNVSRLVHCCCCCHLLCNASACRAVARARGRLRARSSWLV